MGALDLNGSLRTLAPPHATYLGVDMVNGAGVDLVLDDPHVLPFPDETFDAVVATSCFEHDPMFWVTFLEIVRVTRMDCYIYINSPSNGWFHQHPRDNWRFYPDAGLSLRDWARRQGFDVTLVGSFIGRRQRKAWNDCVMVFRRGAKPESGARISDCLPMVMNLRCGDEETAVRNYSMDTEDQQIIHMLVQEVASRDQQIVELRQLVELYEQMLEASAAQPAG